VGKAWKKKKEMGDGGRKRDVSTVAAFRERTQEISSRSVGRGRLSLKREEGKKKEGKREKKKKNGGNV